MDIKNFKINFYGCKNNHKINNIILNEYEETQKTYLSSIICDLCKKSNKITQLIMNSSYVIYAIKIFVHCVNQIMIKIIKLLIMMIKIIYAKSIIIHFIIFVKHVIRIYVIICMKAIISMILLI